MQRIAWGNNRTTWVQFLKFCIVGLGNAAVYFSAYYLILKVGAHYLVASALAWGCSVLHAFCWNRGYVFSFQGSWWKALFRTYISYSISFMIGMVSLYLLVEMGGVSEAWAIWLTYAMAIPLNFVLNKFWAFRN